MLRFLLSSLFLAATVVLGFFLAGAFLVIALSVFALIIGAALLFVLWRKITGQPVPTMMFMRKPPRSAQAQNDSEPFQGRTVDGEVEIIEPAPKELEKY